MIAINIIVAVKKEKTSIRFEQISEIAFPWRRFRIKNSMLIEET